MDGRRSSEQCVKEGKATGSASSSSSSLNVAEFSSISLEFRVQLIRNVFAFPTSVSPKERRFRGAKFGAMIESSYAQMRALISSSPFTNSHSEHHQTTKLSTNLADYRMSTEMSSPVTGNYCKESAVIKAPLAKVWHQIKLSDFSKWWSALEKSGPASKEISEEADCFQWVFKVRAIPHQLLCSPELVKEF